MNHSFHITFILRRDKIDKQKLVPIYIRITIDKQKFEISTGRKIDPIFWDVKKCQPKISNQELKQLNLYLNNYKNQVYDVYSEMIFAKVPITLQSFKERLLNGSSDNKTILELANTHNSDFESFIGIKYSYGSYKNYKTTYGYLKEFIKKKYNRLDLILSDINYQFVEDFHKYLLIDKPCNNNGAVKHIQRLKKILNFGRKRGLINYNPTENFKLSFEPYYREVLTWQELLNLIELELSSESLRKVLDCFLIQCFTGLSYIDLKQLKRSDIICKEEQYWIFINRQKTAIKSTIPIIPQALEIINKYLIQNSKINFLPVFSNQKMNKYLKKIAELASIKINLSTHSARHTFATTVALNNGVPIETISKILGHNNVKTTQIYAKVLESKIIQDMKHVELKFKNK